MRGGKEEMPGMASADTRRSFEPARGVTSTDLSLAGELSACVLSEENPASKRLIIRDTVMAR